MLMSDGVIWAGEGELMNLGWTWEDMADYTLKCTKQTLSASRLAAMLSQLCDDLYGNKPGDDTTVAVARVIEHQCEYHVKGIKEGDRNLCKLCGSDRSADCGDRGTGSCDRGCSDHRQVAGTSETL